MADATARYHESLAGSAAEDHLNERGLMGPSVTQTVEKFRLGFVGEPLAGHEMYRGMLAVPYLRRTARGEWSVVAMRFRCIRADCDHSDHPGRKYATMAGDKPRLFNTVALLDHQDRIAICEGEIDAITATVLGVPAVGVPGVEAWQSYFGELFLGHERVWILADNDDSGQGREFAVKVAKDLPNALVVPAMAGEDVNSMAVKHGPESLRKRIDD
ncbi:toprim domain-containing protein [Amycolatopsis cihanbeyliensis]|uniref:Toprim domain-containing protein n=1 Tax=Amycolatopsis cihanbeyliensis TaxID=1128664 RepID=A0A542DNH6_AMYCI|nr:toprim domain-containing protein [Amycolatopsis cihanbeyliensis]TQJ04661.1 Toprim domain-containing protein [Amycolatopsis cihanbeyliensis]